MINITLRFLILSLFVFYCAPKNNLSSVQTIKSNSDYVVAKNNYIAANTALTTARNCKDVVQKNCPSVVEAEKNLDETLGKFQKLGGNANDIYAYKVDNTSIINANEELASLQSSLEARNCGNKNYADQNTEICKNLSQKIQNAQNNVDFENTLSFTGQGKDFAGSDNVGKYKNSSAKVEYAADGSISKKTITRYYENGITKTYQISSDGTLTPDSNPPGLVDAANTSSVKSAPSTPVKGTDKNGATYSMVNKSDGTFIKTYDKSGIKQELVKINGTWAVKSSTDVNGKTTRYKVNTDGTSAAIAPPPPIKYDEETNKFTNLNENFQSTVDDLINDPNRNDNVTLSPDNPMLKGAQSGAAAAEAFLKKK
jgi:hypothetical protein